MKVELWLEKREVILFCFSFFLPSFCTEPKKQKQKKDERYRDRSIAFLTQLQSFPRNLGKGHMKSRSLLNLSDLKALSPLCTSWLQQPVSWIWQTLRFSFLVPLPQPNTSHGPLVRQSFSSKNSTQTRLCYGSVGLCCFLDSMRSPLQHAGIICKLSLGKWVFVLSHKLSASKALSSHTHTHQFIYTEFCHCHSGRCEQGFSGISFSHCYL